MLTGFAGARVCESSQLDHCAPDGAGLDGSANAWIDPRTGYDPSFRADQTDGVPAAGRDLDRHCGMFRDARFARAGRHLAGDGNCQLGLIHWLTLGRSRCRFRERHGGTQAGRRGQISSRTGLRTWAVAIAGAATRASGQGTATNAAPSARFMRFPPWRKVLVYRPPF